MNCAKHTLYIVATPIGNRGDLTERAADVLRGVSHIYAEASRHRHEHNEATRAPQIVEQLQAGASIALISDAGTPLISDPGYLLVRQCLAAGVAVSPIPGPSALTAALSICGLPTDRFLFAGFPPARATARIAWLRPLAASPNTLVLYESPHRINASLASMVEVFGAQRQMTLLRELTKRYETVLHGSVGDIQTHVSDDANQQRGEFVLVIAGAEPVDSSLNCAELDRVLAALLPHVPIKTAARIAAELLDTTRKIAYDRALLGQQGTSHE